MTLPTFQISRYPVTYRQFQVFIDDKEGFYDPRWWEGLALPEGHNAAPGDQSFKFWNHPRERVSWYDAIAFCRWFSVKLGGEKDLDKVDEWVVRLSTEFEWEKAARGTDKRIYPYGDKFDVSNGNIFKTRIRQTTAVGIFPQGTSPYGVQDMSGNVWEWCLADCHNLTPKAKCENIYSNMLQVLRGGSWYDNSYDVRAVARSISLEVNRYDGVGFRIVRPPSVQP